MQILTGACGSAHLRPVARALQDRDALAGLWIPDKNITGISPDKYRRCWPYHLAMKPFYHLIPMGIKEKTAMAMFPLWGNWIRHQQIPPIDVAYTIMGHATELFEIAERTGAFKVIDASSSHPTSFYGFWQRECDLWCPGVRVGISRKMFARANRELERADVILCPSKFVRDSMLYNGIPEAKCFLNPYGVDTSTFTPRTTMPAKPRFVCVGTICLRKGHQYLFRAFEKVRKVLPDAELICAGGFYPDFQLEKKHWQGTFTHYENLNHSELAKILREATAFVFPSNEEGFARAIIEGMAAGLPIIATHESGATTLVDDGVEGIIVEARNVDQIAKAMVRVATNHEENERMGHAAHARGAKNNSWGDFADRLIKMCAAALEMKKTNQKISFK
ncbi:MAG TPA: glycosyltransferase family 4 protein [Verrucomicrobiae bacterium]|jgi:glycosyltransferase involved in cell wall biosynthesis|nr:glycosyltransferase family 4 protein [Verrucomicrobiae bacterium]